MPVVKAAESLNGSYPVHLMIEYGEKLKHYTGEIRGRIEFGPVLAPRALGLHMAVIAIMSLGLYLIYRKKWKAALNL